MMSQEQNVQDFIGRWKNRGHERQDSQQFWNDFLENVLGREDLAQNARFEYPTASHGYIDVLIPDARLLIEQKGSNMDLDKPEPRSGRLVTPVEQAMGYVHDLPFSLKPRWVCTCNFTEFRFYDLDKDPLAKHPFLDFPLENLEGNLKSLLELFGRENSRVYIEQQLSLKASGLVAGIHSALYPRYLDPKSESSHTSLALLTMRIVFCLYAEDAGLFRLNQFTDYVDKTDADDLRDALIELFKTLDTPTEKRDPYLKKSLSFFPYVDGGLFSENIEIPTFDEKIKDSILEAGRSFDWKGINPVIFGSLMEETLSHAQRRQGGMHYTSPENIHRVIDPLFLDDLKEEFLGIVNSRSLSERKKNLRLDQFHDKIAGLQFLDPACGSGNFLTETYLELRELENRILQYQQKNNIAFTFENDIDPIKVSIGQMHGIEINGFAVSIAKTALWIAEQQSYAVTLAMMPNDTISRLPLKDGGHIVQGNALRMDWNSVLPSAKCSYVMGNPPFIGQYLKTTEQADDLKLVWGKDYAGYLDYSTGWYRKASQYLKNNYAASFAFVSTNSITQGQPVANLFEPLKKDTWRISFAHKTFVWNSESTDEAHVHVVIIGMDQKTDRLKPPVLYTYQSLDGQPNATYPHHVNGYLLDAPDVFLEKRMHVLSKSIAPVNKGSQPTGKPLLINDQKAYQDAMSDPIARKYIRKFTGSFEMIHNHPRWCLWMVGIEPSEIRQSTFINQRIEQIKKFRLASKKAPTRASAKTSWLFGEIRQPHHAYVAIPRHFSGGREWATCDHFHPDVIIGDSAFWCEDPSGFNFAVIESRMYMVWQRAIGGRIKSDYRFSNTIVWNNLPLPRVDEKLKNKISEAGKNILTVRMSHQGQSLADLYNPDIMPMDLRKAHENLDKLVDVAFGSSHWLKDDDDARLAMLFNDYAQLTESHHL